MLPGSWRLCGSCYVEVGGYVAVVTWQLDAMWQLLPDSWRLCDSCYLTVGGYVKVVMWQLEAMWQLLPGRLEAMWQLLRGSWRLCGSCYLAVGCYVTHCWDVDLREDGGQVEVRQRARLCLERVGGMGGTYYIYCTDTVGLENLQIVSL